MLICIAIFVKYVLIECTIIAIAECINAVAVCNTLAIGIIHVIHSSNFLIYIVYWVVFVDDIVIFIGENYNFVLLHATAGLLIVCISSVGMGNSAQLLHVTCLGF